MMPTYIARIDDFPVNREIAEMCLQHKGFVDLGVSDAMPQLIYAAVSDLVLQKRRA